eukprot:scaffold17336_cov58-Phaeocystis_antarctica.AAC.1
MCGLVPQLALPRLLAGDRAIVVIDPVSYRSRCRLLARVKVGAKVVADVEHVPEEPLILSSRNEVPRVELVSVCKARIGEAAWLADQAPTVRLVDGASAEHADAIAVEPPCRLDEHHARVDGRAGVGARQHAQPCRPVAIDPQLAPWHQEEGKHLLPTRTKALGPDLAWHHIRVMVKEEDCVEFPPSAPAPGSESLRRVRSYPRILSPPPHKTRRAARRVGAADPILPPGVAAKQ